MVRVQAGDVAEAALTCFFILKAEGNYRGYIEFQIRRVYKNRFSF